MSGYEAVVLIALCVSCLCTGAWLLVEHRREKRPSEPEMQTLRPPSRNMLHDIIVVMEAAEAITPERSAELQQAAFKLHQPFGYLTVEDVRRAMGRS